MKGAMKKAKEIKNQIKNSFILNQFENSATQKFIIKQLQRKYGQAVKDKLTALFLA